MHILLFSFFTLFLISCGTNKVSFEEIPNNITLNNSTPYLKLNPYNNAPLSAELHIQEVLEELTITVKGQDGENSDLSYTWENSTNTVFPIVGMYFNFTNTVILSTPTVSKTLKIVNTNISSDVFKSIEVLVNNRPNNSERKNFLNFFNPVGKLTDLFATDNYGKIRWYLTSTNELHSMKFDTKNNEVIFSILNSVNPKITTYNMVGKIINEILGPKTHSYTVPESDKRFHHDMFKRDNGNIIVLDKSQYGVEDMILELDPKGKIVQEIAIGEWIRKSANGNPNDYTGLENFTYDSKDNPFNEYASTDRYPGMPSEQNAIDWAHINALSFDEKTDTIYLSFRQHGVFAFDYNTQQLKWIFLRSDYTLPEANRVFYNFPDSMEYVYNIPALRKYILKGSEGPDHPHAITFLGNNKFMVFDNSGDDGNFPEEGSRLLIFDVDENTMTASIDWEYRHPDQDNSLVYSQIVSDIDKTPFGSYIGTFGSKTPFTYIEVTEDKKVLFDMRLDIRIASAGDSDIAMPIACPMSRLSQNGVFLYRGDYSSIYPSFYKSID